MAEIMTTEEVADYLRTSVESIKRMARRGALPASKVGRNWRFRKADLDDWLATGGSESEDLVTEGLAAVTRERMATAREEDLVDWEDAKKSLAQ
jgi:excisionase family DNA binding protein